MSRKAGMGNLKLDKHISRQFNEDLEDIKTAMLAMGGLVEKQLEDAISSVIEADSKLAEHIIATETKIDEMEASCNCCSPSYGGQEDDKGS